MTRIHAARQLLALGPLTLPEFAEITGWPTRTCRWVLTYLVDRQAEVKREGGVYQSVNQGA